MNNASHLWIQRYTNTPIKLTISAIKKRILPEAATAGTLKRIPIPANTTPINNTYIQGTSTQLFQAYFYDYSLNTSNTNVSYANSTAAWTNTSLTCYNTSMYADINDSYICNTTIDLSSFTEGTNISYYFMRFQDA